MILFVAEVPGLDKYRADLVAIANRASGNYRRVHSYVGQELRVRNKRRLDAGVDVDGVRMKSKRADAKGKVPLGGASGPYGRSLQWLLDGDDLKYFSTHIGADVTYSGKDIVPVHSRWLTIPIEASGGYASGDSFSTAGLSLVSNRTGRRARHYKNTFFKVLAGRLWLLQKEENSKRLRFLFLLTKRTRRPANKWTGWSTRPVMAKNSDIDMTRDAYGRWVMEGRL